MEGLAGARRRVSYATGASPGTSATTTSVLFAGLHPIYLLFGIAMITMCFNLVQVEVINSVKGVGQMLRIIKDSKDDEDY